MKLPEPGYYWARIRDVSFQPSGENITIIYVYKERRDVFAIFWDEEPHPAEELVEIIAPIHNAFYDYAIT